MFKIFLLNNNYSFNLNGDLITSDGCLSLFDMAEPNIEINIDGSTFYLDRQWLGLVSHYELNLKISDLLKVNFVKCLSRVLKLKCKSIMVFTKPIIIDNSFRLIPGFCNYAITDKSIVKSIKTGKILSEQIGPYGYPYVNMYDPDKSKWRSVSKHILLARAFVINKNPDVTIFVNHKDGNKLNCTIQNLEWVTSLDNNLHAVNNDLRIDNIKCKVLDIKTKEINSFNSITSAFRFIGFTNFKSINKTIDNRTIPHLFLNRYEIKKR